MIKAQNKRQPGDVVQLNSADVGNWNFAPRSDWSEMSDTEHFVQFYEADGFLLNSLKGFIGTAIKAGDGALVVATPAHRESLDELLLANGVNVTTAKASGQYVSLDAATTLSQFMIEGMPEPDRLNNVMSSVISSLSDGRSRLRAFGEMVALLWTQGNYKAAIRLEELWNELQQTHSFSLFCAYPMTGFAGQQFVEPHDAVCATHSRVLPAETYAGFANPDERLRAIARLQQQARSLQAEISERQAVEERLKQALVGEKIARAEAEAANRMKDEFLATVSHELRTPLNAIMGWTHLLRSGRLDEPTAVRAVETIDRNAKSQAQLIEDILDVSRVITGKLRLKNEPVDLAAVINSAVDSVQLAADSKNIQLEIMLDPSVRHTVGDSSRLQQVVWNLLANAIKFSHSNGRIEVKVQRAGSDVCIRVSDTGQGISPEFLPYIFDRFRQADGTTTRAHGGLGLGLAIVRHLVELHGGRIAAESEGEGRGATFTINLPLVTLDRSAGSRTIGAELSVAPEPDLPLASLAGVRVLLVDDDVDTLQMLKVTLEESKATVQSAASVGEALEIIEWFAPTVLVSDLAMPGQDGYSLIGKIRGLETGDAIDSPNHPNEKLANILRGKHLPAVALTSYVRIEDRTRALSAGFNVFVPKPVQPDELINAIANLAEEPVI